MCRWFAYISATEPCLLEDVLVTPAHSLSKQVHEHYLPKLLSHNPSTSAEPTTEAEITTRNRLFNVDGFGMAWYTPSISTFSASTTKTPLHPALYRFIQPPLHDANFRSICANTETKVLFAHIRAATSTAITQTNNHPFVFGIHTIMHNGYISDFTKIKRKMCEQMTQEAYEHIQGGTDTEHFAALLISFLCSPDEASKPHSENDIAVPLSWEDYHSIAEIQDALQKTISIIITIQTELLGAAAQPNDLNIAITDGRSLVACRFRNHATEQPPSLYYSTTAGVTLNRQFPDHPDGVNGPHRSREGNGKDEGKSVEGHNTNARKSAKEHGRHVIVASEPTTYKYQEWILIGKNNVMLVDEEGEVTVERMVV
ncbi:N-terminal nucleophile aminohydrolase [Rhexocercosporidium sp. MPI-PUGE-AT-0058]|nr:N-terminal nucleophile aminohydrolase [Rhexocercosporidium sp. MPI-PUGE-AT-0058]